MLEFLVTISVIGLVFCVATVLVSFLAGIVLSLGKKWGGHKVKV